jgi:hypothetical protein
VINYKKFPWNIAPLLAHELVHTLSVGHPWDLPSLCEENPVFTFCRPPNAIPANCACDSTAFPAEQCLMTNVFGKASINAAQYTACDIEVMNYFSSKTPCLFTVNTSQMNMTGSVLIIYFSEIFTTTSFYYAQ